MPYCFLCCFLALLAFAFCALSPAVADSPKPPAVVADAQGVSVHGQRTILMIGSFHYFRIDPSDWDRWLGKFADSGYNTIDCYVPWNFHEPTEGKFDFSSPTHDLPRFLRLCQKHHLYVFLRGGPYICSEWDGGGLPAWMIPKPGLEVRNNDPAFLACLRPYLREFDRVVKPYLATNGGPIILSQLENELDYLSGHRPTDTRGYLSYLRDAARQDGIDIPLTACVGGPGGDEGPLRNAMGLADGIIPTGNFYVSGAVEADARRFINAVHGAKFAGGGAMADLPVICSETNRDENTQRRLLAGGLKGVAPFLFVSGSNGLFHSGDTNWADPIAFVSTSVDYGGMISFTGTETKNWHTARRLAGFVNTVSDALCRADSDTNWEGGFSASNAALGADEGGGKPRRLYRLAVPNGPQFVFLWNGSSQPQATTLTVGALTLPRHSTLSVAPQYDQIIPLNVSLAQWGLPDVTLRYTTSEIYHCARQGNTTTLTLTGNNGDDGEISLSAAPSNVSPAGQVFHDGGDWTLPYKTGQDRAFTLAYGQRRLVIQILPRQELDALPNNAAPTAQDLLSEAAWQATSVPLPAAPAGPSSPGSEPPTLESLGILGGAAWYEAAFQATPGAPAPSLTFAHAGDIVTAYLNGKCLGTQIGVGNALHFDTAGAVQNGQNTLAVRVEVWGHSNFDDGRCPDLRLNSPRGLWGPVTLGDAPLSPADGWHILAEDPAPPSASGTPAALTLGTPGQGRWLTRAFPVAGRVSPNGYLLRLDGSDLLAHLFLNGHALGRTMFGPAAGPHIVGGPAGEFYVPAAWLNAGNGNLLSLYLLPTSATAAVTRLDWTPVGE